MNKFGISEEIFNEILDTFKQIPEITKVVLFGSRARGDYKKTSDIDLAVTFNGTNKKLKLIRMLEDIRCILRFDVVNVETISNDALIENIKRDGIVIWNKK